MVLNRKKIIKVGGFSLLGLFVLFFLLSLCLNYFFKDDLIKFAIDQINKQVNAQINIRKVDFSIWKQFPNASVEFDQVFIQSSTTFKKSNNIKQKDTLLVAQEVFLEFNLFKLLGSSYELKKLNVVNGILYLCVDKESNSNFDIFSKPQKSSDNHTRLELKNVLFTKTRINYLDQRSDVLISGFADELTIKGSFEGSNLELNVNAKIKMDGVYVNSRNYLREKETEFTGSIYSKNQQYDFKNWDIRVEGLKFKANCQLKQNNTSSILLSATGDKLDFGRLLRTLPENISSKLSRYKGKGVFDLKFELSGLLSDHKIPAINLNLVMKKGSLAEVNSGIKLTELSFDARYSNGNSRNLQSSKILVKNFSTRLESGSFDGNFSLSNFVNANFSGSLNAKLNLRQLKEFLKLDSIEQLGGNIDSHITFSGQLDDLTNWNPTNLKQIAYQGQVLVNDVGVKVKNSEYNFQNINGLIKLNNDIFLNNLSFNIHENDFLINGNLHHGLEYLFKQTDMVSLQADILSRNLDLSKYFEKGSKNNTQEYSRELLFPDNLNLDVKIAVNNFKLNRFEAKWINGYLTYKPRMFVLKSLSMETLSGRVSGNGAIIQDINKNFIIKGQSDISKIDIQKLFYSFNNFSQDVVRDNHLRGKLSGTVNFSSEWNNRLMLNKDQLAVEGDLTILNGELVNFEPMMGLSKFISLNELQNIKFSTLKNKIYIKDKQIVIPQMDIQSSAFNISGSGIHNFDNHYTYKIKVLLSDVLAGKARKAKKENNEFGIVEDDGLGKTSLYLTIVGFNTDYKISYDSRKALDVVKESFVKQKFELKDALNKEFGWFKNDSSVIRRNKNKKTGIQVDWEEPPAAEDAIDTKSNKSKEKPKKKPSDGKVKVEWE